MDCFHVFVPLLVIVYSWGNSQGAVPRVPENATTTDIINLLRRNSRHVAERPGEATGSVDIVSISFYISGIRQINELGNEVLYDMYFRYYWTDPRLQYEGGPAQIILQPDVGQQYFWFPDIFFANSHDVNIHEMRSPTSGVRLKRTGEVLVTARLTLNAFCGMDLTAFPRDIHECGFHVESYMYKADQVHLNVTHIDLAADLYKPHNVRNFQVSQLSKRQSLLVLTSGDYHTIEITVNLTRVATHYLVLVYVPCGILTVLATLLFWLPPTALFERVLYGSFLLMAIIPIALGSQYNTPAVGYLKAIDVWVIGHFMFIAVAVLEVLIINLVFGRVLKGGGFREGDQIELVQEGDEPKDFIGVSFGPIRISAQVAWKIDMALRIIYPTAYVLFNAVFWAKY